MVMTPLMVLRTKLVTFAGEAAEETLIRRENKSIRNFFLRWLKINYWLEGKETVFLSKIVVIVVVTYCYQVQSC